MEFSPIECFGFLKINELRKNIEISFSYPRDYLNTELIKKEFCNKCFPDDNMLYLETTLPQIHSFVLNNSRGTRFVTCLMYYKKSLNDDEFFSPEFMFVISPFNYLYLNEIVLKHLYYLNLKSYEKMVNMLEFYFKLPKINYKAQKWDLNLFENFCPIPLFSIPKFCPSFINPLSSVIFNHIGSYDFANILSSLLCEKSVILITEKKSIIAPIMETILALLYPLKWKHNYISLCTKRDLEKIKKSQIPSFVGFYKESFDLKIEDESLSNFFIFDLDLESDYNFPEESPNIFKLKIFKWYKKAIHCFPSKIANLKFHEIILDLLFGDRNRYYDKNCIENNKIFFKKLDNSKMIKIYKDSINYKEGFNRIKAYDQLKEYYSEMHSKNIFFITEKEFEKYPKIFDERTFKFDNYNKDFDLEKLEKLINKKIDLELKEKKSDKSKIESKTNIFKLNESSKNESSFDDIDFDENLLKIKNTESIENDDKIDFDSVFGKNSLPPKNLIKKNTFSIKNDLKSKMKERVAENNKNYNGSDANDNNFNEIPFDDKMNKWVEESL